MTTLKIGIIGCGRIAMGKHLPNLYTHPDVSIIAFHNRTRAKALEAKDTFGDEDAMVYDDPYALIEDARLDAIHVLTANDTHHPYTLAALKAGKHVMCEKPITTNHKDAQALIEEKNRQKKRLGVAFQNRHREDVKTLKRLIDQETLGEIYHVKVKSIRRRGIPSWGAFTRKNQGGGPLIDIGSHALDLALHFTAFKDVAYVSGSTYQNLADTPTKANRFGLWDSRTYEVEDSAFAFIQFKEALSMTVEASYALNTPDEGENVIELFGTKAGASLSDEGLTLNYIEDGMFKEQTLHVPKGNAGKFEADDWIEAVLNNHDPLVKAEEAVFNMRIIDAIYASAKKKSPIAFDY